MLAKLSVDEISGILDIGTALSKIAMSDSLPEAMIQGYMNFLKLGKTLVFLQLFLKNYIKILFLLFAVIRFSDLLCISQGSVD